MGYGGRSVAAVVATVGLVAGGMAGGSSAQANGPAASAVVAMGEATPGDRPVTFRLGLDRDSSALWQAARLASTPGSSRYRQFVTLRESGRRYGASAGTIAGLRAKARGLGMTIAVDPSGLFALATAPARVWSTIYASPLTTLRRGDLLLTAPRSVTDNVVAAETARGSGDVFGAVAAGPPIPGVLRPFVTAVIPMSVETSEQASAPPGDVAEDVLVPEFDMDPAFPTIPTNSGTPGRSCLPGPDATSLYTTANTYTPRQLHTAYGTRALHEAGLTGRGARMTILSTTTVPGAPLEFAARCFGYAAPTLEMSPVPGAGRDLSGDSQEVLLDVQTAAAVLPAASSLRVVQAPLTPGGLDFLLWSVTSFAAALDATGDGSTAPDVVSMSVGLCRTLVDAIEATTGSAGALELAEDLLATAAVVGTGVFASSGDAGSSDCARLGPAYSWQETAWPASSKWVTAVGGTLLELDRGNRRSAESVWNDARLLGVEALGGAGGGPSSGNAPWYQAAATPNDRRVVPDLVAHASGVVGWPVAVCSDSPCGASAEMASAGGTSASTPFVAATFALMSAGERAEGRPPLGFVNPWIYRLGADGTGFYDVAVGDNAIAPGVACCVATRGFDQASGLGAPRFRQIAARIPPPRR